MAHPKKKRTRRQRGHGRAHLALKSKQTQACAKCGQQVLPHTTCLVCGTYKGRQVLEL